MLDTYRLRDVMPVETPYYAMCGAEGTDIELEEAFDNWCDRELAYYGLTFRTLVNANEES